MKIGLVGYPGAGKSTVFGALTGLAVATGGAGDKARLGAVKVPDARVDALANLFKPKKKTYAEIAFTDLAGGHGEGLDRGVLNAMRPLDALCQVVRAFPDAAGGAPDPLGEITGLATETILADLEIIESRLKKIAKDAAAKGEVTLLERLKNALESEQAIRELELGPDERKAIAGYTFLTLKPLLLVLNVGEDDVAKPPADAIVAAARERGLGLVVLSGAIEM